MLRFIQTLIFSVIVLSVFSQSEISFLDCNEIIFRDGQTIQTDSISLKWGKKVLIELKIDSLTVNEKAKTINDFLYNDFKYTGGRSDSISEIIDKRKGNCVSHAIMGIFLLRLAGIPAKFAHEVHIMKKNTLVSFVIGKYAIKNNDGINSYWHNDHVWVWFKDENIWKPFDSALGITGFEQFYERRYLYQRKMSNSLIEKWTGPPFCIWEDNSHGLDKMNNVTKDIWTGFIQNHKSDILNEWLDLVNMFSDWKKEDFYREYLDNEKINKIRDASEKWFRMN